MARLTHGRQRRVAVLAAALALVLASCTPAPTPNPTGSGPAPSPTATRPVPTPTATPPVATQRIVFGDPWSSDHARVYAVAKSAMAIIDGTRKGQSITLSMFNMTDPASADALLRAFQRGVEVRVLVNHESGRYQQVRRLRGVLGTSTRADSWIRVRGGGVRMHSKFMLASGLGGRPDVVWVSSGNFTLASGRDQANEALITTGDTRLYDFLIAQFDLLRRGIIDPEQLGRTAVTETAVVRTFPITDGSSGNDPVEALLNDVTCVHGSQRTIVRMAQLLLTKERLYLTDKLRELKSAGCDIRMVVHESGWLPKGRDNLLKPGAGRVGLRSARGTAMHTKITTIEGWDAAGDRLRVAMVGTHNLSGRAFTTVPQGYNDELSLTILNPAIVAEYSAWVDKVIRKHSAPVAAGRG